MKSLDMRFDESVLKDMIGQSFKKYKCDAFDFTNSVTQIVGLYIGEKTYSLSNRQNTIEYFGREDDVAIYTLEKTDVEHIKSAFSDVEMIDTPVDDVIHKIILINENQTVSLDGEIAFDIWLTRTIIFFVGDREVSFEKDTIPFSEEIIVRRGYNLVEKSVENKFFLEGWPEGMTPRYKRDLVSITE